MVEGGLLKNVLAQSFAKGAGLLETPLHLPEGHKLLTFMLISNETQICKPHLFNKNNILDGAIFVQWSQTSFINQGSYSNLFRNSLPLKAEFLVIGRQY